MCSEWKWKKSCSKTQIQSLLGSLLYITKCVCPARFFLNIMLQALRDNTDLSRLALTQSFHQDLNWFLTFLTQYNGITYLWYHRIYMDQYTY